MAQIGEVQQQQAVGSDELNPKGVQLSWCALTDVGLRRKNNEDSVLALPPLFVVADGMGGHSAGEIASTAVVTRLAELGGNTTVTRESIDQALGMAVADITEQVGVTDRGTGTTVSGVALSRDDNSLFWECFNIGDSRVYQLIDGDLSQITTDHSVVQHLIDSGAITEQEAESHPHSNVITRAVGFNETPVPDYYRLALMAGQRLLICSDGLTKELTQVGIEHFLSTDHTAEEVAHSLMAQALANSGRDNITVVVIDVESAEYINDDIYTTTSSWLENTA